MQTVYFNAFRIVDIIELGFQLSLSIFDEASVWNGTDVNEAVASPDINVFLLAVRQVMMESFFTQGAGPTIWIILLAQGDLKTLCIGSSFIALVKLHASMLTETSMHNMQLFLCWGSIYTII